MTQPALANRRFPFTGAPVNPQEMGHTHPALALRIYAAAMRRGEDESEALAALVGSADGGPMQAQTLEHRSSGLASIGLP